MIATGLEIKQQDIEPVLIDINLKATPIFMDDERCVLNPIYNNVIKKLITERVDQDFIKDLKGILAKSIDLHYPEAQLEFQDRPIHPMIEADLRHAALKTNNQTILYWLLAKPESANIIRRFTK